MEKIKSKKKLILYGASGLGVNMLNIIVGSYLCSALLVGGFESHIESWTYLSKDLVIAGGVTIVCTLAAGFIGEVKAIGGFLLGNIIVGLFLALYMSNAGGLWDNSKKYIEAGNNGGKGSVDFAKKVIECVNIINS